MRHMTDLDIYISEKIREYRKLRGFSQERLAAHLGVTFQQLQKYESSRNRITASKLYLVAHALKVPIEDFMPSYLE